MRRADDSSPIPTHMARSADRDTEVNDVSGYESPKLVDLGSVRNVVLGSASSGKNDANGQYYW